MTQLHALFADFQNTAIKFRKWNPSKSFLYPRRFK